MMLFPSWQTLSEYFPVLALKSSMRRIDPLVAKFKISFQVLQIVQGNNNLSYSVEYKDHRCKDCFGITFVDLKPKKIWRRFGN